MTEPNRSERRRLRLQTIPDAHLAELAAVVLEHGPLELEYAGAYLHALEGLHLSDRRCSECREAGEDALGALEVVADSYVARGAERAVADRLAAAYFRGARHTELEP